MSEKAYSVVGYVRVSTGEQAESGAGLESQRAAIASEAERRGWDLGQVYEDAGASGKSMNRCRAPVALQEARPWSWARLIVSSSRSWIG